MNDAVKMFETERRDRIAEYAGDGPFGAQSRHWLEASMARKYVYNFDWMGRPIIQYPNDMVAVQELIWRIRPDVIVETGIAHGGSLVLSASMLALLDMCDAIEAGKLIDPRDSKRRVVGVDIDIRPHNRQAIADHPMASRIRMIEGSSVEARTVAEVRRECEGAKTVLVFLDSMHTHEHVLAELDAYAPLVTPGSYCVVFDTFVEDMPKGFFSDRPWDVGNNPRTAVRAWLPQHPEFAVDHDMDAKLQVTVAPGGFLRRIQ